MAKQKPIAPYNRARFGGGLIPANAADSSSLLRAIKAGKRWVAALGHRDAWALGMIALFDCSEDRFEDKFKHTFFASDYPAGRFIGYAKDNNPGVAGWPVVTCLNGKYGMWAIPPTAIPDLSNAATIGCAVLLLRKFLSPEELTRLLTSLSSKHPVDIAEDLATAAESIAANVKGVKDETR